MQDLEKRVRELESALRKIGAEHLYALPHGHNEVYQGHAVGRVIDSELKRVGIW